MSRIYKILATIFSTLLVVSSLTSCDALSYFLNNLSSSPESSQTSSKNESSYPDPPDVPDTPEESKDERAELYNYQPTISKTMPAIHINTTNGKNDWAIQYTSGDKWADRIKYVDATINVENCEPDYEMSNIEAEVKVRGNFTLEYPKKPIRIKFKKKNNILGLHDCEKYKNWVLLADWKDLSMSNNTVAFYLGKTILGSDGYYSTDFRNVEVYLNGQYWGVYLLVEQQEVKDGRTSVPETEDDYTGNDIGYFFEYDGYYTNEQNMANDAGDPTFTMSYNGINAGQIGYTIKNDIYDDSQITFLQKYMNGAFYIAYQATFKNAYYQFNDNYQVVSAPEYKSAKEVVSTVIDIQSLVDTYILNEIACDADIAWSSFYLSLDMTAKGNKKITFEAPWDFDSCFGIKNGICNDAQGLYAANSGNPWFKLVVNETCFQEMVSEKWAELKKYKVLENTLAMVEKQKTIYSYYYLKNYNQWSERIPNGNHELVAELNSYKNPITAQGLAADYLINWLKKRFVYLDSRWTKIETNENLPLNSVKYIFEAENATLGNGLSSASIRTGRNYASGSAYVGSITPNSTITFNINAMKATTVYLFVGVSKLSSPADFDSWFKVTINNTPLLIPYREVPAVSNGEEVWHTFISIKLAPIELVSGKNTITFTANNVSSNFDYIEIYSPVEIS